MKIKYDVVSDVGCVRDNNEDMALVFGSLIRDGKERSMVKTDSGHVRFSAIVADGMGGYGGGEIASELTAQSFDKFIVDLPVGLDDAEVRIALSDWLQAHKESIGIRQQQPGLEQMGTTLTGIFTYEDRQYLINIGDSRVYRLRNETLRQLTEDHSERNRTGDPTVPSNLIYNAIGIPGVFITAVNMTEQFPMIDGDKYVVCSDGLSDMIDDDTIERILNEGGGAQELVDAAKAAGGRDNCTVIVLQVSDVEQEQAQVQEPIQEAVAEEDVRPLFRTSNERISDDAGFAIDEDENDVSTPPPFDEDMVVNRQVLDVEESATVNSSMPTGFDAVRNGAARIGEKLTSLFGRKK